MIPKARIKQIAKQQALLATTVQKDYALGWLLFAIAEQTGMGEWAFKGGTCLKKCYFETYRFSEDLDFTIPKEQSVGVAVIEACLRDIASWIEERCGLTFPRSDFKVEEYKNPRGNLSYQAKIPFAGPIAFGRRNLQRVKFDLTQDELIARPLVRRAVHHAYDDSIDPVIEVQCYSVNELLAEKTRALVERSGRARDVYDVVNISRNFRDEIDPEEARAIAQEKFAFKSLEAPTTDGIFSAIDQDVLRANWEHQLKHQLPILPDVQGVLDDLFDAVAWWLEPEVAQPQLQPIPIAKGELVPRQPFPEVDWRTGHAPMHQIRFAARNRLCAIVNYSGSQRLVEPYSLRYPSTGSELLHVWELTKNGTTSESHKSFKTHLIESASVSSVPFRPQWLVEL